MILAPAPRPPALPRAPAAQYYCHFEKMSTLGAEPHLNTCFKHYMYFVYEFNLIPNKVPPRPQFRSRPPQIDAAR